MSIWRIPDPLFLRDQILEWVLPVSVTIYDFVMPGHDIMADAIVAVAEVGACCWAAVGGGGIEGPMAAAKLDWWLCHLFLLCSTRFS